MINEGTRYLVTMNPLVSPVAAPMRTALSHSQQDGVGGDKRAYGHTSSERGD